jgi:hypothetical protein
MDNGDNTVSLMIGDGETNVNALPDLLLPEAAPMQRSSVDNDILIL